MRKQKKSKNVLEKIAIKIAKMDANTACSCITYQPKLPKEVERLRKF